MLLEKVSMHIAILFVHCCKFLLLLLVLFLCFVENCTLLPKGIAEFVVFLCIVHLCFLIVYPFTQILLLVIKGQFFPEQTSAFFFSYTNAATKPIKRVKYTLFP